MTRRFLMIPLLTTAFLGTGQSLKSVQHGLEMVYGDFSKEEIIKDVVLKGGNNHRVTIFRFDHVGDGTGLFMPMIISTREPIRSDSLGLVPLFIDSAMIAGITRIISESNTNIVVRPSNNYGIFRITFQYEMNIFQYFTQSLPQSVLLFKKIEQCLLKAKNEEMLERFYTYLHFVGLVKYSEKGGDWKY